MLLRKAGLEWVSPQGGEVFAYIVGRSSRGNGKGFLYCF